MDIRIGVVGFGTIGSGVVDLVAKNSKVIFEKTGINLIIHAVADLDFSSDRGVNLDGIKKYTDGIELVNDSDIDIVIELVGGIDYPLKLVKESLKKSRHIVSANKALFAKSGPEIYTLAAEKGLAVGIEASVAGGIPIIKSIKEALVGNNIQEIRGIINGTSNYIMTKMTEEGKTFDEALKKAQELGLAEADPTLDVNGGDASHKIAILAALAFNTPVLMSNVYVEGIDRINLNDVKYAEELGYVVKLIAIAKDRGKDGIEARVHPMLVPMDNQLAGIRNEFNAVFVRSDYLGDAMFTGRGAGSFPTASAVVADIVDIGIKMRDHVKIAPFISPGSKERNFIPFGDTQNRYYLHFTTADKLGVLSKITGILGDHRISIASVIQKESDDQSSVPLLMMTHEAKERDIVSAVDQINSMTEISKKTVIIRAL